MKLYKYRLLTAIMAAAVIFASCSKDGVDHDSQSTAETNKTTQKLISFRQDLFSKNGGSMTSDSAEWHLEGLFNFELANNTHLFEQLEFLYDTLAWPESNGEINFENLQQLYANVNELAQTLASQNGNPDYTFDVIDLQVLETGLKSGEKAVVVAIASGLAIPTYIGFNFEFGPTDYWSWGWKEGKCDDFTGQYDGFDATTELEKRFNSAQFGNGYFVSVEEVWGEPGDFPAVDNPFGSYMIFENTQSSSGLTYCISPEEMNYYLSKFGHIKNFLKPTGKSFKNVAVIDDFIPMGSPFPILHRYRFYYGNFIAGNLDH